MHILSHQFLMGIFLMEKSISMISLYLHNIGERIIAVGVITGVMVLT